MSGVRVLYDARVRWIQGREAAQHGEWVGQPPIEELYQEQLDSINYIDEEIRRTLERGEKVPAWLARVRELVVEVACAVRVHGLGD